MHNSLNSNVNVLKSMSMAWVCEQLSVVIARSSYDHYYLAKSSGKTVLYGKLLVIGSVIFTSLMDGQFIFVSFLIATRL